MSELDQDAEQDLAAFEPGRRRLCPDGECVGLVGADGRCRVCGQRDDGATPGLGAEVFGGGCASQDGDDDIDGPDSGHHVGEHELAGHAPRDFDPARKLCPDGACLGVLELQRCNVCGRDAAASG